MARYFISVGGTGQHVALALTRLVRAQALRDIRLIALDSDNRTPLPLKLQAPVPSLSGERHPLQDGTVKAPFDIAKFGEKSFEALFVDPDHPEEQDLFQCLFDDDQGRIPIHKGMYGTPSVGATVFAEGANSDALQSLLKPLSAATQVFVCGSVVGGTGAGLIHKLIGEIRHHYPEPREIYGIFLLPWFSITNTGGGSGAISQATITRNSAHGVKYFYEHTIPRLTASLLLGYPGTRQTAVLRMLTVGDGDMSEHPSYLHLAAARAVLDLPQAHTANRAVRAYGMLHDTTRETWLLDEEWETGRTLRALLRALRLQHNFLTFLVHEKNRKKMLDHYEGGIWGGIISTADAWKPLDRSICANVPEKKHRKTFVDQMLARFAEIREEVELCVSWAQGLFPSGLLEDPNDNLMRDLSAAFAKGVESAFHWEKLQELWSSHVLQANPNHPHTARDVADHHATVLFEAGLKAGKQ